MDKTILDCVQKFKKQKRKQFVQQIKAQKRKELLIWISKQDLKYQFKDTFHSKTITSLSTILENCKHILISPIPLCNNIVDEEEVIGIECHIGLYREINVQKSHQNMVQNIMEIVLSIIEKYTCLQIHQYPDYEMEFYKLIDIVADQIYQSQKQPQIIQWFQSKESIWVIYKIIKPFDFVNCRSCPNIFKIILQALATKIQVLQINALLLLHKIIKHSESKYLFYIYQQYFAIPYLIVKKMGQRLARKQFNLKVFWNPLICLLKTFDEAIIGYAKTGVIKICGQLIATGDQANIQGALQILNAFSQIYQDKIINILLSNQTSEFKSWITCCVQECIYKHSNYQIRKQFAIIITNLMSRVDLDQLKRLQSKFSALPHGLLGYLQGLLCFQHQDIQTMGLKCVDRLIMCVWKMDKHSLLGIVHSLENHNIVRHINILNKHRLGDIREMCGDLIADIDQIKRNNGMLTN